MAIHDLTFYPSDTLRSVSIDVENFSMDSYGSFLRDLEDTMRANNGLGLAAPQIGRNIRVAIIQTKDGILPLINPIIEKKSFRTESGEEGCLSIPEVFGTVRRHYKITVSTLNPEGKRIQIQAHGLFARVIQHEIDHLDGVLFIDVATKINSGKERLEAYELISKAK